MESSRRQNLSEQVAGRIKQLILENGLKIGDRLPTEQEMADRFGVSRVSVREATKALSFLGIIRAAPRRGLTVGEVDMRRVTEYLGFQLALTDYPKTQLVQTRLVIETGALPYIARRMADEPQVLQTLRSLVAAARQTRDARQRIESDVAFHRGLLAGSGIGPLLVFNDLLQIFFLRFGAPSSESHWKTTVDQHERLVESLGRGDLDAARQTLEEHLSAHRAGPGD
jgi:GntR family transcriptional repressor for pyruvate dehydrogenase complex